MKGERTMSTMEVISKMVESIKDEIKRHMETIGTETLEAGQYIARFTTVQSSRFDTKRRCLSHLPDSLHVFFDIGYQCVEILLNLFVAFA